MSGIACNLKALESGEKGMKMPIAIILVVKAKTGAVAQLCIKGIFRVRIICTISVCDNRLSINQPV